MIKSKFKIPTWFINQELDHKVCIEYDGETKRAYELLDILNQKYTKIDQKKLYNMIEITEEEYDTWYVYFLEYYIGSDTIFYKSNTEKEAKKLLNKLKRFFGLPKYDGDHRWGNVLKKLFIDYQLNN